MTSWLTWTSCYNRMSTTPNRHLDWFMSSAQVLFITKPLFFRRLYRRLLYFGVASETMGAVYNVASRSGRRFIDGTALSLRVDVWRKLAACQRIVVASTSLRREHGRLRAVKLFIVTTDPATAVTSPTPTGRRQHCRVCYPELFSKHIQLDIFMRACVR